MVRPGLHRAGWPHRRQRGGGGRHAIGVAEIILPAPPGDRADSLPGDWRAAITGLVAALAGQGVTATCSWPDGPRYGALDLDSNLPDVRIALGGPEQNPWTARLLAAAAEAGAAGELGRQLAAGAAPGYGCPRPGPGRRRSRPVPTCAARATCRC